MKVVLDFDRVLFDTDRFIADMKAAGIDVPRGAAMLKEVEAAELDWKSYVNSDVLEYLGSTSDEVYIVSSYVSRYQEDNIADEAELKRWQSEKIRLSGLADLVKQVYVVGNEKVGVLEYLKGEDVALFVDDESDHVGVAKEIGYEVMWFRTHRNQAKKNAEGAPYNLETAEADTFTKFLEWRKSFN